MPTDVYPGNAIFAYLRYATGPGAPVDDRDMNINASVVPATYEYVAGASHESIHQFALMITDAAMDFGEFGGLAAALANGISIQVIETDGVTVLLDFMDGEVITVNDDLAILAGRDVFDTGFAAGTCIPMLWDITRAFGDGRGLQLRDGQAIRITLRDDLTGLTGMRAFVQGLEGNFDDAWD